MEIYLFLSTIIPTIFQIHVGSSISHSVGHLDMARTRKGIQLAQPYHSSEPEGAIVVYWDNDATV